MSCILSQLNILCTSLVKSHYTENDNSPVIHHSHVTAILVFSDVLISLKRCVPYVKTFSTLSGVRIVFWILRQIDILCTCAEKRCYAKNDNSPFQCHLFTHVMEFMEAWKTCHRVFRTSIWPIRYSGELCNKNCIVKTSETLIVWSASCYTARSGKRNAIKGVPDRLLKSGDGV